MDTCEDVRNVECGVTEQRIKAESLCPTSKRQYPLGILVIMGRGISIMNAKRKCFECLSGEE